MGNPLTVDLDALAGASTTMSSVGADVASIPAADVSPLNPVLGLIAAPFLAHLESAVVNHYESIAAESASLARIGRGLGASAHSYAATDADTSKALGA